MKNKFIRTMSPITFFVVAAFDAATVWYAVLAAKAISNAVNTKTVFFAAVIAAAIVLAFFLTKNVMSTGVVFFDDKLEFNGVDNDNVFEYEDIESVRMTRDEKISLKKNFVDRYSIITLCMKDGSAISVELGLTTKRRLKKICLEIENRIRSDKSSQF